MKLSKNSNKPKIKNIGTIANGSLGPLVSLEEHVHPDWWAQIFNSLYLKTDGDIVNDSLITLNEINEIEKILGLEQELKILDLCCGQGRHLFDLARRGYENLEGLDRSNYLIQKAKKLSRQESLKIGFKEGDARNLPYLTDSFDVVLILGNSFGYFETLQDDLRVLNEVFRVLKPWGRLLIDLADGEFLKKQFQPRSWEWIDNKLFVCRERSLSIDEDRLVTREVVSHINKGVVADQFYAERLYTPEKLTHILKKAKFRKITFPLSFSTDSKRGQDLGMMQRRIMTLAHVKKEWSESKQKQNFQRRRIAVLLGDPKKPDLLKPDKIFDDDDFYTIDRMKAVLNGLQGFHFSYINNHDRLIEDLKRISGNIDFVINFCDEGYGNSPQQELHVPALLDMLKVPYSGSGPQCLAYCYDKSLVRGIANEMNIPTPRAQLVKSKDSRVELSFDFPVLAKPNFGDSSFGITQHSYARNPEELIDAIQDIREKFGYEKPILVEEFLVGKDLSFGIIGTPPSSYIALPIVEEDYSKLPPKLPQICGYEAKWRPDSPYWNIKSKLANLPENIEQKIVAWSIQIAERLECRDYTRFDWRLDGIGEPRLLEVNPNPGWCWDGHLAKMAKFANLSYEGMLRAIINAVEKRLGLI